MIYMISNNGVVTDNITLIHGDTINYRNKINEAVTMVQLKNQQ